MKLAYNPIGAEPLSSAPSNNDITFDLPGLAIYVKGTKFDGKEYPIFKKSTSFIEGYNGLVPYPSYNDNSVTRFLREDGNWVIPEKTTLSNLIISLTGYTKATFASDLVATDTLNSALGKLEYKSDYAYDWIVGVTAADTDEYINKWGEIVDFIDSVKEGTDITDEFVTRKTYQIITGSKAFTSEIKIYGGDYGVRLFGSGEYGYLLLGLLQGDEKIHKGKITGYQSANLTSLDIYSNNSVFSGSVTASKFVKSGGTSALFLKADGSVDSNTYATTGSLENYVTLNTSLTITGSKTFTASTNTFSGSGATILTVDRNGTSPARIRFCKNGTLVGYIGIDDNFKPIFLSGESGAGDKEILHSGNYTSYAPILNSSSTHATNTSVIYAPTTAGTKGLVLTSNGSGAPTWVSGSSISVGNSDKLDNLHASDFVRTVYGKRAASGTKYVKLGTLPVSSNYTYDSFVIKGSIGGWSSPTKSYINISISRRESVGFLGSVLYKNVNTWDIGVNLSGEVFLIFKERYVAWSLSLHTNLGTIDYVENATPTDTTWTLLSTSSNILWYSNTGVVDSATIASKVSNALTFSAGNFATKTYNGSYAVTVKIPTHTSHLTNDSGYLTQHQSLSKYSRLYSFYTGTESSTTNWIKLMRFNHTGSYIEQPLTFNYSLRRSGDKNTHVGFITIPTGPKPSGVYITGDTTYINKFRLYTISETATENKNSEGVVTSTTYLGTYELYFEAGSYCGGSYWDVHYYSSITNLELFEPKKGEAVPTGTNYITSTMGNFGGNATSADLALKVKCQASTTNNTRPLIVTNTNNELYYTPNLTFNPSTGILTTTYLTSSGASINTQVNTTPLLITREGYTEESLKIGIDDSTAHFYYENDETSNSFKFTMYNSDTESGKKVANTSYVTFTGNSTGSTVTATTFVGNLDGQYINKLTGYSKATAASDLTVTDTLNTALSKLEYKTDTAYTLIKGAYDGDGTIENLVEILKVLEGISDTDTIQSIIGKYLPLTGGIIKNGNTVSPLVIKTDDATGEIGIKFSLNGVTKGWLGYGFNYGTYLYTYTGNHRFGIKDDGTAFCDSNIILHSGNYSDYTIKKDGTGATGTWNIDIAGYATALLNTGAPKYANCLEYKNGLISIGEADGNAYLGSSGNWKLYSFPENSTVVSSGNFANIQNIRLGFNEKYFHDIFLSPNLRYLWHRYVHNNTAHGWTRLVEEDCENTSNIWNISIGGSAKSVASDSRLKEGLQYYYATKVVASNDNTGAFVGYKDTDSWISTIRVMSSAAEGALYYTDLMFDVNSDSIWSRRVTKSGTPSLKQIAFTSDFSNYYAVKGLKYSASSDWDWNDITDFGTYKINNGTSISNHPKTTSGGNSYPYGLAMVLRGSINDSESRIVLLYFPHNTSECDPLYLRMRNYDTWKAWSAIPSREGVNKIVTSHYWANINIKNTADLTTIPTFGGIISNGVLNITGLPGYAEGIRIHHKDGRSSVWFGAKNNSNYDPGMWGITVDSSGMRFRGTSSTTGTSESDYMNIIHGGNVGIGTTNPAYKLDIVGNTRITSSSKYALEISSSTNGAVISFCGTQNSEKGQIGMSTSYDGNMYMFNYDAYRTNPNGITGLVIDKNANFMLTGLGNVNIDSARVVVLANGNMGIGTNAPTQKLHVNGNVLANKFIASGSDDNYVLLGGGGHKTISDFMLKSDELTNNITAFTKTLTVTQNWMDTGISGTDLNTGTYIVQVTGGNSSDHLWSCLWSGVLSWYMSNTNDVEYDEIILHRAGHAYHKTIYLRTIQTTNGNGGMKLLIAASSDLTSSDYTFKFKRII